MSFAEDDQVIEDVAVATHRLFLEQGDAAPSWFVQAHERRYCNMPECQPEESVDE